MIKQVVLLSALCTGTAWAQQNLDISEKDVASGAAQARLSAVARQAASSGKRVVVTAPQHLHAQIAAGLAAGGKADVVLRDGFYENGGVTNGKLFNTLIAAAVKDKTTWTTNFGQGSGSGGLTAISA
jgi:hypothetical protein